VHAKIRAIEEELASFARASLDCTSQERFRDLVLRSLASIVPHDAGIFLSRDAGPNPAVSSGWDPVVLQRLVNDRPRYWRELLPAADIARPSGGVIVDRTVFTHAVRARLAFYRDIAKPQALTTFLLAWIGLRGVSTALLALGRRGLSASFKDDERAVVATLLPVITLGDSAHVRTRTPRSPGVTRGSPEAAFLAGCDELTPREREIVGYIAMGMRNEQIATACGSSLHTVRNQLHSIFRKTGVATRTELAHAALRSGFVR